MDSLGYIDNYFKGEFPPEEARQFEKRIQEDAAFAEEVAFYLSAIMAGKEQLEEERKLQFRELYQHNSQTGSNLTVVKRPLVRRMVTRLSAAAMVAAVVFGLFVVFTASSPQQLADRYIKEKLETLPVNMGPMDSIQNGSRLYNEGKFGEALQEFAEIIKANPADYTAIKHAGIASLRLQDYDRALDYFRKLESFSTLHANPAVFYQALTLMKRNQAGDAEKAKQLLHRVEDKDLDRKQDAQDLLKKM